MNLTTLPRVLVSALALTGAALGFAAQTAQATAPESADASVTHRVAEDPEPVEVGEDGRADLSED
ncbi:hypothetical protein [Streptomyces showdoensis]|uniref:Uncharacterized protein n=1 Tax=Streptomyces showdoensis TaxID=68268 RepID=A0A2P2GTC6_STREW|nr:hypothetical protein [Streptomyces showdoensis]KKZ74758.1 hypothetical protein VO63_06700 [Streptomyces showdoensis]